jgi:hypothetical protein
VFGGSWNVTNSEASAKNVNKTLEDRTHAKFGHTKSNPIAAMLTLASGLRRNG